jgi:hypothetical protein
VSKLFETCSGVPLTISLTTRPLRGTQRRPRPLVKPWAHLGSNQGPPGVKQAIVHDATPVRRQDGLFSRT